MPRSRRRKSYLGLIFKGAGLVLAFSFIGLFLYCWFLSLEIENRFSGRRWGIPSKVYSDTTLLYPGQDVNRTLLEHKLKQLGYRNVSYKPKTEGEMRMTGSSLALHLHKLDLPSGRREGFPVRITFREKRIESIVHPERGGDIPLLEMEPEQLMLFFGPEREQRRLISIKQVPEHVIHAILAAEDTRFFRHRGIDPRGILRALYANLRQARIREGGSTITQQLAKNYFLTPERTFSRKLKEILMSITMEVMYKKDEILEIYLNEIYLGQKGSVAVNGIGEASYFYFGKPVEELLPEEAAVIAGLIRAPNLYSPYVDKTRCRNRRDTILRLMQGHGWLERGQLETSLAAPVSPSGFEKYGRKAPYFMDYLSEQLRTLYPPEALTRLGLTIFTTLDTQVQRAAEKALARGLARLESSNPSLKKTKSGQKLQGAILVMQPKTGYVLAMVGGRNYGESQFNRITQARRQPGSAFKPFVFLSGLDQFTPVSQLSNVAKTYIVDGKPWRPRNYASIPEERLSLRRALAHSVNLATVDLAMTVGLEHIVDTTSRFKFSTPLRSYPSLSLGASEVIPLELARAYCSFAADGMLPYPLSLKDIMDDKGAMLQQRHINVERVMSPAKAFLMSSLLQSVVEEGTARSLNRMGVNYPVGGKTGTTNDFRDAWFVGYTPDILALVWVGFDDGTSIGVSGSSAALPIWADLMKAIPQHVSGAWFRMPPGIVERTVCAESGQLAAEGRCPETFNEFFLEGHEPEETCPIHRPSSPLKDLFREFENFFKRL